MDRQLDDVEREMIDYPLQILTSSRGILIELQSAIYRLCFRRVMELVTRSSRPTTPARSQAGCCVLQLASNLETAVVQKNTHRCGVEATAVQANSVNAFPASLPRLLHQTKRAGYIRIFRSVRFLALGLLLRP